MRIIQNLTWLSVAAAQGPVAQITIDYDQDAVTQIGLAGSYLQSVVYPTALVVDLTTSDYNASVNINGVSTLVSARTLQGFQIQKGVAYLVVTGESDSSGHGPTGSIPLTFYARQSDAPANVQNFLALIAQALSTNPGNPSVDFNANHFLAWAGEHAYKFGAVNTPVDLGSDGHNMVVTVDGTAAPNTYGLIVGTNDDPPITAPVYASRFYIGQGGPNLASDTNGNPALVSKNSGTNAYGSVLELDGSTLARWFAKDLVLQNNANIFDNAGELILRSPVATGDIQAQDASGALTRLLIASSQSDGDSAAASIGTVKGLFANWHLLYSPSPVGVGSIPVFGNWGNGLYYMVFLNGNSQVCTAIMLVNGIYAGTFTIAASTTFAVGVGTIISGLNPAGALQVYKLGA